jgi:hypothetical protein
MNKKTMLVTEEAELMSDIIFAYTREQAIEDGVLRDVSKLAKEAGFRYPVAVTAAVWADCVAVPDACSWQDEAGRLWDVLTMLGHATRKAPTGDTVRFTVLVQNDKRGPRPVELKAVCGPGDDARQPVITVMLLDED